MNAVEPFEFGGCLRPCVACLTPWTSCAAGGGAEACHAAEGSGDAPAQGAALREAPGAHGGREEVRGIRAPAPGQGQGTPLGPAGQEGQGGRREPRGTGPQEGLSPPIKASGESVHM
ncbi:unnamed protein product, partial [Ixodes pacificus]